MIEYSGSFHFADMDADRYGTIILSGTGDTVNITASTAGEVIGDELTVKGGTLATFLACGITIRCTDRRNITCETDNPDIKILTK